MIKSLELVRREGTTETHRYVPFTYPAALPMLKMIKDEETRKQIVYARDKNQQHNSE